MTSSKALLAAGGTHESWCPLLELAVREVFELMLSSQLTVPPNTEEKIPSEVTAMVGLAGKLCGLVGVHCSVKCASLMTSKMLGVEVEKAGPDMSDALGEISNMVAGNFKNKISGLGDGCMLSPPTVITGSDYSMYSLADSPALEVRVVFESMLVVVSLQVHE